MENNIENIMKKFTDIYTPEHLAELSKRAYEEDRHYPENFSNWYKHIIDFGKFRHAEIISNQIFTYEETEIMRETDNIEKVDWDKINKVLEPTLNKMENMRYYSIKNGAYSNKFDFNTSIATKSDLAKQLWLVNYNSTMFDTGGYTELVVREFIPSNHQEVPTIYNGMPLREEIRVFYNFDTRQIEYVVDYWDYDYCAPNMHNKSDAIIFDWFHNKYGKRKDKHKYILNLLEKQITTDIDTLKFDAEMTGIWSIDFMLVNDIEAFNGIWLIDMARGYRSAYWDPKKCKNYKEREI